MSKQVWISEDGGFIGARGVNSVREMAELIATEPDLFDSLYLDIDTPEAEHIEQALIGLGVHAMILSVGEFAKERWDDSRVFPCDFGDKPGRGYVKVLGVNL